MNPYLKFCSTIYQFYLKRDSAPIIYTFFLSSVLLGANFIAICDVFRYFDQQFFISESIQPYCIGGIALLNLLLVILPGKYKSITPGKNWSVFTIMYIVFSLAFIICIGWFHRERNLELKEKAKANITKTEP